jgi:hypothetical protein
MTEMSSDPYFARDMRLPRQPWSETTFREPDGWEVASLRAEVFARRPCACSVADPERSPTSAWTDPSSLGLAALGQPPRQC